jgi:hypothetical protein
MASIVPLLAAASAASAADVYISAVNVESYNTLDVNGTSEIASAIDLTVVGDANPVWVWCVDLSHQISIAPYSPPLAYQIGPVNTDSTGALSGTGNPLSQQVSGEIQTLAEIGTTLANSATPDPVALTAIQGAIWEIEYNYSPAQVTGTPQENTDIANDIAFAMAHPASGYAQGLYPVGASGQGFGASQGFATGVPEPTSWAMLIVGFGAVGARMRRRAHAERVAPLMARVARDR